VINTSFGDAMRNQEQSLHQRYEQLVTEREALKQMEKQDLTQAEHKQVNELVKTLVDKASRLRQEAEELLKLKSQNEKLKKLLEQSDKFIQRSRAQ
jgi:predicted transcriptional regulator